MTIDVAAERAQVPAPVTGSRSVSGGGIERLAERFPRLPATLTNFGFRPHDDEPVSVPSAAVVPAMPAYGVARYHFFHADQ